MEILASSVQKAGELFLHAGYLSAQGHGYPTGSAETFVTGVMLVGAAFLVSLFFENWIHKMLVVLSGLALVQLVTGCSELPGDP